MAEFEKCRCARRASSLEQARAVSLPAGNRLPRILSIFRFFPSLNEVNL